MDRVRRTKIVATLGPATDGLEMDLVRAGLDVARLNFSHGTTADHAADIAPADDKTLDRLVNIAEVVYKQPDKTFEQGISQALTAVLASPRFLFRLEEADPKTPKGAAFAYIDEYSLASRLSLAASTLSALPRPVTERTAADLVLAPDTVAAVLADEYGVADSELAHQVAELTAGTTGKIEIVYEGAAAAASLAALGAELHRTGDMGRALLPEAQLDAAIDALRRAGARLVSVTPVRATLEEYFVQKLAQPGMKLGGAGEAAAQPSREVRA